MYFFSDWYVIKHLCLSVYINIFVALFLIRNSLILFSHEKSVIIYYLYLFYLYYIKIYYLFSCPKKNVSSQQRHFNLIRITACVFTFICTTVGKKLNQTGAIKNRSSSPEQREMLDSKFNKILYWDITMFS